MRHLQLRRVEAHRHGAGEQRDRRRPAPRRRQASPARRRCSSSRCTADGRGDQPPRVAALPDVDGTAHGLIAVREAEDVRVAHAAHAGPHRPRRRSARRAAARGVAAGRGRRWSGSRSARPDRPHRAVRQRRPIATAPRSTTRTTSRGTGCFVLAAHGDAARRRPAPQRPRRPRSSTRRGAPSLLDPAAPGEGPAERYLVGVLEIAAHGQTAGEPETVRSMSLSSRAR